MADLSLSSLDPRLQRQFQKVQEAFRRSDFDYTLNVTESLLKQAPGCLEIRQLRRRAQIAKAGAGKARLAKLLGGLGGFRGGSVLKKDPGAALLLAEEQLTKNPESAAAHRLLGDAAMALEFPATAVFAYDAWRRSEPDNAVAQAALVRGLIAAERAEEAMQVAEQALRKAPADADLLALVKDASVAVSMHRGAWDAEGDYRGKLADESEAVSLEQAARRSGDAASQSARRVWLENQLKTGGERLEWLRELAQLAFATGDFDAAESAVKRAQALPAGSHDPGLVTLAREIQQGARAAEVERLRAAVAASPEDASIAVSLRAAEAALASEERAELAARVVEQPQDAGRRRAFGDWLLAHAEASEAAAQFQRAMDDPRHRVPSLIGLGRAFRLGGKRDLATEQLLTALQELPELDETKKAVHYDLAELFAEAGDHEAAKSHFKTIYAVDLGFRDVAAKMDGYYAS